MRKKKKEVKNKNELIPFSGAVPKKVPRKRLSKKEPIVKPRCSGTMSEAAYWSFIRSCLRQKSRWWKPISIVKQKNRRAYTAGENKRQKFEYQCNNCRNWFPDKEVQVDHIIPAGALNCAEDLPGFVERLFCEEEFLQVLCSGCHNKKTMLEKKPQLSIILSE